MANIDEPIAPPVRGDGDAQGVAPPPRPTIHDPTSAPVGAPVGGGGEAPEDRSLLEDLEALYHDGRTYASSELTFQKTRASFVSNKAKSVAIFGAGAALSGLLALIGLTVGAIFALSTLIGPLAATLVVVGILLIAAYLCIGRASAKWAELTSAFEEKRP